VDTRGRIGLQSGDPPPDVEFDDLLVEPSVADGPTPEPAIFEFNPSGRAARAFAEWRAAEGEWGVGITENKLYYSLVARTGMGGTAVLEKRKPLQASVARIALSFRAADPGRRSSVSLTFRDARGEGSAIPDSELRILSIPGHEVGSSRQSVSLARGDLTIASVEVAKPATGGAGWRTVALSADRGRTVVTLDGETIIDAPEASDFGGRNLAIGVSGDEGTIYGFERVIVESRP
jgi:hypothetical protein